jgi:two-component system, LytTR family, response regulator
MVNALLLENKGEALNCLENLILKTCPDIRISCKADTIAEVHDHLRTSQPEVIFLDIDHLREGDIELVVEFISADFEVIFVTETTDHALEAFRYGAAGYILKPVQKEDLIRTVTAVIQKVKTKEEQVRNKHLVEQLTRQSGIDHTIGVPTLEGFEFVRIAEIVRCEGLQKCTRIITTEKTDLISSYNLGEFRKLLEPYGFFSPHKSHLINLKFIRKYNKEGSIIMHNGSYVPVAKRKKKEFLNQFTHF